MEESLGQFRGVKFIRKQRAKAAGISIHSLKTKPTMPFDAKILRILIASPSDVADERNIIPEIINDWNVINSVATNVVLMPVKWETHASPMLGDRPQAIINEQLVKNCDLLIGVFWTRIGTDTGLAISGTAEEIEQFRQTNRPVMLYFSQSQIDPDRIDPTQFAALKKFKEEMRAIGLLESYDGIPDFQQKLFKHLSLNIRNLIDSVFKDAASKKADKTKIKPNTIKPVGAPKEQLTQDVVDAYLTKAIMSVSASDGWARIAAVGHYLSTYTPIDYHDYKFPKLKGFLESREMFEFKEVKGHPELRLLSK